MEDLKSAGLRFKGQGCGGEFMEFTDKQGRLRIKIHPPDHYSHINCSSQVRFLRAYVGKIQHVTAAHAKGPL